MKRIKIMLSVILTMAIMLSLLLTGCSKSADEATEATQYTETEALKTEETVTNSSYDYDMVEEAPAEECGACPDMYSRDEMQNTEEYGEFTESTFLDPKNAPLSTLSIDVDTASYSNIRRYLQSGMMPPSDAVRVEECINYFSYKYDQPKEHPIGADITISNCPWNENRYLARVAIQGEDMHAFRKTNSNLVFLLDVSGSMNDPNKLPLVKSAMQMLSKQLSEEDKVSIVVYAGASGVVLDGCDGDNTSKISRALNALKAGGSTAGGDGIRLAYAIAEDYFIEGGNNRVILCTDGDFNVGPSSVEELEKLIEKKRESGVFLSVLGFGTGNTKDNLMETLADKGNGNYAYIDSILEAKKVLIDDMTSTLYTIAKDVKIQVEFNPEAVKEYRLVGYDNRRLNAEDFNDDKKDAGEIGAGHTVTVFYELILQGTDESSSNIDDLVFGDNDDDDKDDDSKYTSAFDIKDWMYVKIRYKEPDEDTSKLFTQMAGKKDFTSNPDGDFQFATAVAEYALLLKDSDYAGDANFESLIDRAKDAKGKDEFGYRAEFIQLAELAEALQ